LAKGDAQLDITFQGAAHHIPENLSEITYYVYAARVAPVHVLQRVVRANFQAKEYPQSMQRMYEWTPDECIPEFFTDVTFFTSQHKALPDIELPPWCHSPADFIRYHRDVLESQQVSRHLHHWIDLNFGHLLHGPAAVAAKNVPLPLEIQQAGLGSLLHKGPGFVQLFSEPHPQRKLAGKVPVIDLDSFTVRGTGDSTRMSSDVGLSAFAGPGRSNGKLA
jgi:WD repeat-containing protein 81